MVAIDFKLYLITDRKLTAMPLPAAINMALRGGVRSIQLREKDLPIRELLALAQDLRQMTNEFHAMLFINDRVDVAIAVGADGVHLGHNSMPVEAVRRLVGRQMLIGVSTHNIKEAQEAERGGADFITFGPVFDVPRKGKYGESVGIESLFNVKKNVNLPIYGLGGVKSGNIGTVMGAGAFGVAMITEIFGAENIEYKSSEIVRQIQDAA